MPASSSAEENWLDCTSGGVDEDKGVRRRSPNGGTKKGAKEGTGLFGRFAPSFGKNKGNVHRQTWAGSAVPGSYEDTSPPVSRPGWVEESNSRPNLAKQNYSKLFEEIETETQEVHRDWLVAYGRGAAGKLQVLSYSHDRISTWGGIFCALWGPSVFRLRKQLLHQLSFLVIVGVAVHFFMLYSLEHGEIPEDVRRLLLQRALQDNGARDGLNETSANVQASSPSTEPALAKRMYYIEQVGPLVNLGQYFNGLVGFLLGLYVALNISRWWVMRSVYINSFHKSSKNIVTAFASVIGEDKYNETRKMIARYCLLSHKLLFKCATGKILEDDLYAYKNEGLLRQDELEKLVAGMVAVMGPEDAKQRRPGTLDFDVCCIPWLWSCSEIQILFRKGAFAPPIMAMLHKMCLDAQSAIAAVEMMLNTPLPFAYSHLVIALVHLAVLLSVVKCGIQTALAEHTMAFVCEIIFSFCLSSVYLGLTWLTAVLIDPFGDDVIDFPAEEMRRELWRSCGIMEALRMPPTLQTSFPKPGTEEKKVKKEDDEEERIRREKEDEERDEDPGEDGGADGGGDGGGGGGDGGDGGADAGF